MLDFFRNAHMLFNKSLYRRDGVTGLSWFFSAPLASLRFNQFLKDVEEVQDVR